MGTQKTIQPGSVLSARLKSVAQFAQQDPRKLGMLGVLLLVLVVLWVRMMVNGSAGPKRAAAAPGGTARAVSEKQTGARSVSGSGRKSPGANAEQSFSARPGQLAQTNNRLREWLKEPVRPLTRNLFAVKLEYYPQDGSRPGQSVKSAGDGEFWGRLEKSLVLQADQRDKRENLLANYTADAARLRLESTIMGPVPKAMIDGKLVAEGDVVASFRVLKIEPRRITVEREGIRLEIQMK